MFEEYLLYVCLGALIVQTAGRTAVIAGTSLRDIQAAKDLKARKAKRSRRPLISVVVVCHNNQGTIVECLDSLTRSRVRKMEIIVVDNASSDNSAELIKAYAIESRKPMRLIRKRKQVNDAYWAAQPYIHGDAVLLLAGNEVVDRTTLSEIAEVYSYRNVPAIIQIPKQQKEFPSFLNLLQRYRYLEHMQISGAQSTVPLKYVSIKSSATIFEYSTFKKARRLPREAWIGKGKLYKNGNTFVGMTIPMYSFQGLSPIVVLSTKTIKNVFNHERRNYIIKPSFNRGNSIYQYALATAYGLQTVARIVEPIAITYFFYLAVADKNHTLFLLSWGLFIAWTVMVVSSGVHMTRVHKLGLLLLAPLAYILRYVQSVLVLCGLVVQVIYKWLSRGAQAVHTKIKNLAQSRQASKIDVELT